MKKPLFSFSFGKKKPNAVETSVEPISFFVTDDDAKLEASRLLSKVKIPASLHTLEKAYLFGNRVIRKLDINEIQVIQKKNLTKEEAYQLNVSIFQHLIEQRDAILNIIGNMVQPAINNLAGVNIEIEILKTKNAEQDRQIKEMREMLDKIYGKHPQISNVKKPWNASLKDASIKIIEDYKVDQKLLPELRTYVDLTDATNKFYNAHDFPNRPDIDAPSLYKNVMQYWKDLK
ncbi:MAG: hypothetical protein WCW35_05295 [Bacteroidota bacterium]